jgi:hypothetical protein
MGAIRCRAEATAKFNRQDFGISADPGMIDQIQIRLDIEMVRKRGQRDDLGVYYDRFHQKSVVRIRGGGFAMLRHR